MNDHATRQRVRRHLIRLYDDDVADAAAARLANRLASFVAAHPPPSGGPLSQRDAIVITYGDMVRAPGAAPLATLARFLREHVRGLINTVHILPFYPYSSDDGFSVIDYTAVDPALGDWSDVAALGADFGLMFDAVVNHISVRSEWFKAFLRGEARYADRFVTADPATDLSLVFRPRAHPLLTPFETSSGVRHVWTTFSADQVDLDYASPETLHDVVDVLLEYIARGARFVRLDAIAYLWKEIGTGCLHLPQTHELIKLLRTIVDIAAPHVRLITETNVPHEENVAYFGDGRDEAHLVYNFALPPLTLHAFHTGDASILSDWAAALTLPSDQVAFFNFLASHDGIGVQPARGLLPETAVAALAERVAALGGRVSYKRNSDGSLSAYELNCNYLDALGDPAQPDEPASRQVRRFLASQAIMLALRGVPGIYFHSLFGSRNWSEGVDRLGYNRAINREKLGYEELTNALRDARSLRWAVFDGYRRLLRARAATVAFHPHGEQSVRPLDRRVFAVRRAAPDGDAQVLAVHNVSHEALTVTVPPADGGRSWRDLLGGPAPVDGRLALTPYQVAWLLSER